MKLLGKFSVLFFALSVLGACGNDDRFVTITGYAQGGTYTVKVNLMGENGLVDKSVDELKGSIDSILTEIDNSLSGYNPVSQISLFNQGETIVPSEMFLDIYEKSYRIYEETGGVVDVASAPLYDIWGFGFSHGEYPSAEKVDSVMRVCGMKLLDGDMLAHIDENDSITPRDLVREKNRGVLVGLNYNAVAQGYSCDLVADYLRSLGVKDMLVDIGEIYCCGHNPKGTPWTLAIDTPIDGNNTPGDEICGVFYAPETSCGIVTSGNYRKFYVKEGRKYAHTIDPRTGYPVSHNLLSATVIAEDSFTADAYATYCMVVGLEEAQKLILERPDLEGCLVYDNCGVLDTWISPGFPMNDAHKVLDRKLK